MTSAFRDNKLMLEIDPEFGVVFEGDTYCIKHQELFTLGLDGNDSCGYCDWE